MLGPDQPRQQVIDRVRVRKRSLSFFIPLTRAVDEAREQVAQDSGWLVIHKEAET